MVFLCRRIHAKKIPIFHYPRIVTVQNLYKENLVKTLITKLWRNPPLFMAYLAGAILVFSYLFFSPQNIPQNIPNSDKIGHIIVFFVLSFLLFKAATIRRRWQMLILLTYGIVVECVQAFIPYRSGSVDDVVADAAGILLFYLVTNVNYLWVKIKHNAQ